MKKQAWIHLNELFEVTEEFLENKEEEYEQPHEVPKAEAAAILSKEKVREQSEKRLENISTNISESTFEADEIEDLIRSEDYGKITYGERPHEMVLRTSEDEWSFGSISSEYVGGILGRLVLGYSLKEARKEVYATNSNVPDGAELFLDDEGYLLEEYTEDVIELVKEKLVEPSNDWYNDEDSRNYGRSSQKHLTG